MDYQTTLDKPTDAERAAVDGVLGEPDSVWAGAAERNPHDDHVARGGFALAASRRHLLLPTLHAVQDAIGWVSHGAINYIAERLPIAPAEAFGVATFYELIATEPRPARVAHVCDDVACLAAGAAAELDRLEATFGPEATEVDGAMWLRSPCLGQCEHGSAAFVQVAGGDQVTVAPAPAEQVIEVLRTGTRPATVRSPLTSVDGTSLVTVSGDLDGYLRRGGYRALRTAIAGRPEDVVAAITESGIRGRGGAAFPAGVKWAAIARAEGPVYVVCNADESEPGTFKDRALMELAPHRLIEAMTIAAFAVGAHRGYVYIRGEYPDARRRIDAAIHEAREAGLLGGDIAGTEFSFDIEVRRGAGAYVCGEETALFNSIEGFRGEPRQKPPFPTEAGLFGRPTLVNNVETLMAVPGIITRGAAAFAAIGTAESTGTKVFCVSGAVGQPGAIEVPFGATARELIDMAGGPTGAIAAVLIGGAAGTFAIGDRLDVPLTFEDTRAAGMSVGSGAIVVFDDTVDLTAVATRIAHFFADESCGLCVPCRVGTVRQAEALGRLGSHGDRDTELATLAELDRVLRDASICGLGQLATTAVQSAIELRLIGTPR